MFKPSKSKMKDTLEKERNQLRSEGYEEWEYIYYPDKDDLCDKELVPVLTEIRDMGYLTTGSCAGHIGYPYKTSKSAGFINFDQELDKEEKEELRDLARKHGLSKITFTDSQMSFKRIGKPR